MIACPSQPPEIGADETPNWNHKNATESGLQQVLEELVRHGTDRDNVRYRHCGRDMIHSVAGTTIVLLVV